MKIYLAPMEGVTGYIYRNAYHWFFNNIDKYFAPFIITNQSEKFKTREINDILPEHNIGLNLIPQLLSNNSKDFISASKRIKELGYNEINLNLGCPSRTVVSKNRGSGFLSQKEKLDEFLYEIYSESVTRISIKTRLGKDDPEEFYQLIEIFNKYPLEELIIHPRIQKDFYKNHPNLRVFQDALLASKNSVCYNGDIFTDKDYNEFVSDFPSVEKVMLGRGIIANPSLVSNILNKDKFDKELLKNFHNRIYEDYKAVLYGEKNVLYKMKELWFYMIAYFPGSEKEAKKIRKSERLYDYDQAVASLFLLLP